MHEVLVNRLGGLSLPRKSVVRLTDRPDMTLDVYRGRKTTMQQQQQQQQNHCLLNPPVCFPVFFCSFFYISSTSLICLDIVVGSTDLSPVCLCILPNYSIPIPLSTRSTFMFYPFLKCPVILRTGDHVFII